MPTLTITEQIQANPDLVPALPDVASKALQLIDVPEVKPADFEAVLSRDPGLVVSMLRLANSPIYGFAHKKESIKDAIIGMGLSGLRGMLMGTTLKRFVGTKFAAYGKDSRTLWRHSMAVATGAKYLTKQLPSSPDNPEEMFICGLLHDLGKLLLAPFLTAMGEDLTSTGEPTHDAEFRLLGLHHMEAGGIVAAKWNLKPVVREVIARHHFKVGKPDHAHAVAVVRLADQCATNDGHGAGRLAPDSKFLAEDLEVVGLEVSEWEEARAAIAEQVATALAGV